jgi:hypothetical protein
MLAHGSLTAAGKLLHHIVLVALLQNVKIAS